MKVLQLIEELEADPTLITQKLQEINQRGEELMFLDNIYKAKKTKLLGIINTLDLPANKLIKVAVELRNNLRVSMDVQGELKAIEYFKKGSSVEKIKYSLEWNVNKWKSEAIENLSQILNS